jgi:lipoate---protein ligase
MGDGELFDVEDFRAGTVRRIRVSTVDRPTLVLGSTQSPQPFDEAAIQQAGVSVIRRRGGGGAVLMGPGDPVWIDSWVPKADPLFDDDVTRAFFWLGESWVRALRQLGIEELQVHRSAGVSTTWSSVVCFSGLGPGEVSAGTHKVVGISQWRAREGALFSSALYRTWRGEDMVALLGPIDAVARATLLHCATGVCQLAGRTLDSDTLVQAFVGGLPMDQPWDLTIS